MTAITSHVTIDEGSTTQLPTYDLAEDAATKKLSRSVLNKSDGTETGVSGQPLQVSIANTGANSTKILTTPDLPSGASTAAKQPALGTAGSSASDVLSVQGIASGTALPVSAAALPLPTGAATAAKQPALGTAGTASADVITVQGKASMTPVLTDASGTVQPVSGTFWQATQPVSGTVTANAGTNLNTSALALDASLTTIDTDLKSNVTLHAGTNLIGKVGIDQTTPGTTNKVSTSTTDTAPATQNITAADVASSTATGANSQPIITGNPTANSFASFALAGLDTINVQISGTWLATLQAEVSFDGGTTWYIRGFHQAGTTVTSASVTANAAGNLNVAGCTHFRMRATAYVSGTAVVGIAGSANPSSIYLANAPSTATDKFGSGTITGSGQAVTAATNGCATIQFTVGVIGTNVLTIEGFDGVNWNAISGDADATDSIASTISANGLITVNCGGFQQVRLRCSTYVSGTTTVSWNAGAGAALVEVFNTNGSSLRVQDLASGAPAATAPANAQLQGNLAKTALPTAVSDGQMVNNMGDKFGRQVIVNNAMRDLMATQTTTISASTAETTIITATSSVFHDLTAVFISNTSASATRVDIRDTTGGSVIFQLYIPAGDVRGFTLTTAWPQTSVNTNWTAQSSASVTDLRVSTLYINNK